MTILSLPGILLSDISSSISPVLNAQPFAKIPNVRMRNPTATQSRTSIPVTDSGAQQGAPPAHATISQIPSSQKPSPAPVANSLPDPATKSQLNSSSITSHSGISPAAAVAMALSIFAFSIIVILIVLRIRRKKNAHIWDYPYSDESGTICKKQNSVMILI